MEPGLPPFGSGPMRSWTRIETKAPDSRLSPRPAPADESTILSEASFGPAVLIRAMARELYELASGTTSSFLLGRRIFTFDFLPTLVRM